MPGNPPLDPDKVDKFYDGYKRPEDQKPEEKPKKKSISDFLKMFGLKTQKERTEEMQKEADKLKE